MTEKKQLLLITMAGLILRLLLLPLAQIIDADATTRIFIAWNWLDNPYLITQGIWLPLHYYFTAMAIGVSGQHVVAPMIAHILLAAFTVIPLFYFTRREFSAKGAWFAATLYTLSPIVFHNSYLPLSGIPYAFFVAFGMNFLSKSLRETKTSYALVAGLFLTLAAGFRYEAWVLIALFTGIALYCRQWKQVAAFWLVAMIFPAFWMTGNYMAHHDIFYGLSGAYNWNVVMEGVNDNISVLEQCKRLFYFPFSWFFMYSPIVVGLLIFTLIKQQRYKQLTLAKLLWVMPFVVMLLTFMYKAVAGTLLLQHRFTTSLVLLSAPFSAIIFDNVQWTTLKKATTSLLIISLLPLSYVWMSLPFEKLLFFTDSVQTAVRNNRLSSISGTTAIPRLSDQNYTSIRQQITEHTNANSGLILDFVSWEVSYYLAVESQLHPSQIFMAEGAKHGETNTDKLRQLILQRPKGVILLKCFSAFAQLYTTEGALLTLQTEPQTYLLLSPILTNAGIGLYEYEYQRSKPDSLPTPDRTLLPCPSENTKEYYMFVIRDNADWYNDIKRKAVQRGVTTEEMLEMDAEWMVNQQKK